MRALAIPNVKTLSVKLFAEVHQKLDAFRLALELKLPQINLISYLTEDELKDKEDPGVSPHFRSAHICGLDSNSHRAHCE